MTFKNEMRLRLGRLEEKMDRLVTFYGEVGRLREQNETLFDKLMAKDWEEYGSSPTMVNREIRLKKEEIPLSPAFDESSIGEVLTDEDIG